MHYLAASESWRPVSILDILLGSCKLGEGLRLAVNINLLPASLGVFGSCQHVRQMAPVYAWHQVSPPAIGPGARFRPPRPAGSAGTPGQSDTKDAASLVFRSEKSDHA